MSPTSNAKPLWPTFFKHRLAATGCALVLVISIASYGAPWITPYSPNTVNIVKRNEPPSSTHWLGTDGTGRDVLTRLLYGGRVSVTVGVSAAALAALVGIVIGSVSGYYGGALDIVLMRVTDFVMSLPLIVLAIALVAVLGPSLNNVIVLFGVLGWPDMARVVRGQVLAYRESMFVEAATALGVRPAGIISKHILPNIAGAIVVTSTFDAGKAILLEAGLSFLGLGVQPPMPSWGNMLNAARTVAIIEAQPWLWLPSGALIAVTVLAINFLGDGLRDALDSRQKR